MSIKYLMVCLFFGSALLAQNADKKAEAIVNKAIEKETCAGLSAGYLSGSDIRWEYATGSSDEKKQQPFTPATLTRIASIAKPMTAIAILQLYEAGKIELDVPVQTYLPEFPNKAKGEITVRHLLHHSSGLGGYQSKKERENKKHYANLEAAVKIFADRPLSFSPGSDFNYTTYGYVVLGRIIESVSGQTYEDYMRRNIWDKAGMHNTGVEKFSENYPHKSALFHAKKPGKIKAVKPTDLSDRIPGGGLYSCLPDMLNFGKAVLNHTLVSESTTQMMFRDSDLKKEGNPYGMGWYLYGENPNYGMVVGHNGAQSGASTFLFLLPESDIVVVVLSNTSGAMQEVTNIAVNLFDLAAAAK